MTTRMLLGAVLASLMMPAGRLSADSTPVTVTIDAFPFRVAVSGVGAGGMFTGHIGSAPVNSADFWCVDSQNSIPGMPTSFQAYLTALTMAGWDPTHTRYGTVPNPPAIGWQYGASGDSALQRYRTAAYLTTLYNPANSSTSERAYNAAVQQAIWRAMDTVPPSGPLYNPDATAVVNLYNAATAYVTDNWGNEAFWSGFRVVSGWYSGGLRDTDRWENGTFYDQAQTFITHAPEPTSLLLLVTAGVVLFGSLRRLSCQRRA